MGFVQSKVLKRPKKYRARILMLGLDSTGKTTLLYNMITGEELSTIPTMGFNVEELSHPNKKFTLDIWDIGGQKSIRRLWRHYYLGAQGLIFVIDSSDRDRLDLARSEFRRIINGRGMEECSSILVFANKQDAKNALSPKQIQGILGLDQLEDVHWRLQPSAATKGIGVYNGFRWLLETTMTVQREKKKSKERVSSILSRKTSYLL